MKGLNSIFNLWNPRPWKKMRAAGRKGEPAKPSNGITRKTVLDPLPKRSKTNSRKRRKRRWNAEHPIENT